MFARAESAGPDGPWTRHAAGTLAPAAAPEDDAGLAQWPPAGAVEQDLAGFYPALAGAGLGYGPLFRGVRKAWRRGAEVFAEVALPEGTPVAGFGVHPALLDAALQVIGLDSGRDEPELPFAWSDVAVHAAGVSAARVRLVPSAAGTGVSVTLADSSGAPVASIASLVVRALPDGLPGDGRAAVTETLFRLEWLAVDPGDPDTDGGRYAVLGSDDGLRVPQAVRYHDLAALAAAGEPAPETVVACCLPGPADGAEVPAAAREVAARALGLVQGFLSEPALEGARLVVVTQRAVDAGPEAAVDVAGAPAWGLVRAAAAEHPGRFVLADADQVARAGELIVAGADLGEPEFAVRGGQLRVPRLARAGSAAQAPVPPAAGTVLITGASGALGGLVARHLVADWGTRHLLLVSRRGALGMGGLAAELAGLGASVRVAACDVADRAALAAVIAAVPADAPLRGVVHAAGMLDDATIGSLTEARTDAVMRAKADGAWHLHELTTDADLDAFVLFSSLAGIVGSAGQGNYAAASTFLDALAAHRRDQGLAGVSVAWGAWEHSAGMAGQLAQAGRQRLARVGLGALADAEGLALLDAAVTAGEALLVPARLDAIGRRGRGEDLPPLMSGLASGPGPAGRRAAGPAAVAGWRPGWLRGPRPSVTGSYSMPC